MRQLRVNKHKFSHSNIDRMDLLFGLDMSSCFQKAYIRTFLVGCISCRNHMTFDPWHYILMISEAAVRRCSWKYLFLACNCIKKRLQHLFSCKCCEIFKNNCLLKTFGGCFWISEGKYFYYSDIGNMKCHPN